MLRFIPPISERKWRFSCQAAQIVESPTLGSPPRRRLTAGRYRTWRQPLNEGRAPPIQEGCPRTYHPWGGLTFSYVRAHEEAKISVKEGRAIAEGRSRSDRAFEKEKKLKGVWNMRQKRKPKVLCVHAIPATQENF